MLEIIGKGGEYRSIKHALTDDMEGVLICVGARASMNKRKELYEKYQNENLVTVICETVRNYAKKTGRSCIIHDGAHLGEGSEIGNNCIINTNAIIEHDVIIGNHCHIAPGAIVIGGVNICDEVVIGAGGVVIKDITEPGFYAGVPARRHD